MSILVIYYYGNFPCRSAILDHIYAFRRYSKCNVFHWNMISSRIPAHIRRHDWDLIIFHTTFLYQRLAGARFSHFKNALAFLKNTRAKKIALPQDETSDTDGLVKFFEEFSIDVVFSVAPGSEVAKLYGAMTGHTPSFRFALTGYLDDRTIKRLQELRSSRKDLEDAIDIGYRSFKATARLGRLGVLKWKIADDTLRVAPRHGLSTDISTSLSDTLVGDDWLRHLLACRYQLGVESGSSLLDRDGSIRRCCNMCEAENPHATFEEIEKACFPGLDGNIRYAALGPRHLEACAAKSCQILIEGEYSGVLEPSKHYIPVRADLSDLEDVLRTLADETRRRRIVETAYADIVESRRYSYERFVAEVLHSAQQGFTVVAPSSGQRVALIFNRLLEWANWRRAQVRGWKLQTSNFVARFPYLARRLRWLRTRYQSWKPSTS